jgi:hypothetical protein
MPNSYGGPHIELPQGLPGIIGPMKAYPETAE